MRHQRRKGILVMMIPGASGGRRYGEIRGCWTPARDGLDLILMTKVSIPSTDGSIHVVVHKPMRLTMVVAFTGTIRVRNVVDDASMEVTIRDYGLPTARYHGGMAMLGMLASEVHTKSLCKRNDTKYDS
jgi:hypothetical protein